jgi:hypothetical protein
VRARHAGTASAIVRDFGQRFVEDPLGGRSLPDSPSCILMSIGVTLSGFSD